MPCDNAFYLSLSANPTEDSSQQSIHMLLGNAGQAHIGNVFRQNLMQRLARASPGSMMSPSAASHLAAMGEHRYWSGEMSGKGSTVGSVRHPPSSTAGSSMINRLAVAMRPSLRAALQSGAARHPAVATTMAAAGVVTAATSTGGVIAAASRHVFGGGNHSGSSQ